MNAERLLAHYERIAEAPDAIARLRRFILDLAVRGKLVPQETQDGDVKHVALTIAPKARGQARQPIEKPYDLPASWKWRSLGTIADQVTDGEHATPPRITRPEVPLITAKNVRDGFMDYSQTDWVSRSTAEKAWSRCRPTAGDILLVCVGATTGRLTVLRESREMVLVRSVALIRPNKDIIGEYLERAIRSPVMQKQIWASVKVAAQPCLYINRIQSLLVPLPPLPEQHRIVAKVDELMALCDQLEKSRAAREETRDRLTAASLARLNDPAPETFQTDARFALDALPSMTARPDQIKQLRQTILNLAVRGKLVRQDPSDEPASAMLARFSVAKSQARKGRDWSLGESKSRIPSFEVPDCWVWTTIDEAVHRVTVGYVGPMKDQYVEEGVPFLRSQNVRANKFRADGLIYISRIFHQKIIKSALTSGDVVVVRSGNVGTACVIPNTIQEGNCSDLVVVKKPECILPELLCFYLNSLAAEHVERGSVGVALTHFNTRSVATMPLPLPPLAEQNRIVAKIDQLMGICDRLEANLATAETARSRLLDALLAETTAPVDARRLEAAE